MSACWPSRTVGTSPPSAWDQVQLVSLPFVPLRRVPNDDPSRYFGGAPFPNPHAEFLTTLSREELMLAETIRHYPYETNEQLAQRLSKSIKTLNNQINAIYTTFLTDSRGISACL